MTRDVLCQRPARILHSNAEIYATTAACGSVSYLGVRSLGGSPLARVAAGFSTAVLMRGWASWRDVKLPTWDTRNDGLGIAVRRGEGGDEMKLIRQQLAAEKLLTRAARDELVRTRVLAAKNVKKVIVD
jgi:hypothetical protein